MVRWPLKHESAIFSGCWHLNKSLSFSITCSMSLAFLVAGSWAWGLFPWFHLVQVFTVCVCVCVCCYNILKTLIDFFCNSRGSKPLEETQYFLGKHISVSGICWDKNNSWNWIHESTDNLFSKWLSSHTPGLVSRTHHLETPRSFQIIKSWFLLA